MKVNFREPNVDRFVEILLVGFNIGKIFNAAIKNIPNGYKQFLKDEFSFILKIPEAEADFICEYPEKTNFEWCFPRQIEPAQDIRERVKVITSISEDRFDEAGKAILKNYVQKLEVSRDGLQEILNMAFVIASMASHKYMMPEDIAEACQYYKATLQS